METRTWAHIPLPEPGERYRSKKSSNLVEVITIQNGYLIRIARITSRNMKRSYSFVSITRFWDLYHELED